MKHERAYCNNGQIYEPKDIKSRNSLVEMRYHGLSDIKRQFALVAVNTENPYFRYKSSPGVNLSRSENNPNHNLIKTQLIELLQNSKSLRVYTYEFLKSTKNNKIESAIINLNEDIYRSYHWQTEVFKKVSNSEFTYFDICGYPTDAPFSSSVKPIIFIEIILSSFLNDKVFEFHCKSSKLDNSITLLFYIPEHEFNQRGLKFYLNNLIENDGNLSMRITHYIDNGYFYINKDQIAHIKQDKQLED